MTPSRNDRRNDPTCPICDTSFRRTGRRRYCSDACRQAAWRRRTAALPEPIPSPATRSRREHTIYCDECDTRYLAEQWCPDCTRPARRLGPGGTCTCGELITVDELLDADL